MGVVIDKTKCVGCGACVSICPGNIIRQNKSGEAFLKRPEDCWSCASCVKECPAYAIALFLPPVMGGMGGLMYAKRDGCLTDWIIEKEGKEIITITTSTKEANSY